MGHARVTAGSKRPHLVVCPGANIPLKGRQGSRGCVPDSPSESGLVSRGSKGLRSPPESPRGSFGAHGVASRDSSLLFSLERGLGVAPQAMQEKKALTSRGRGHLRAFLQLWRPWGFSHEARRGSQGASRAAPGKSDLHACGDGERVIALESREGTRASRRIEEGLSRSFLGCGRKTSFPSTSAGDLRELPRVPLRGE